MFDFLEYFKADFTCLYRVLRSNLVEAGKSLAFEYVSSPLSYSVGISSRRTSQNNILCIHDMDSIDWDLVIKIMT